MKPLQKVVTAQDIQSSLYYLHLDGPADDDLREATYISQDKEGANDLAPQALLDQKSPEALPRKPLPPASSPTLSHLLESPAELYPHFQSTSQGPQTRRQVDRKPVNTSSTRGTEPSMPLPAAPSRGLLGPRSFHHRLHSADSAALEPVPGRAKISPRRWSEQPPPPLPLRPELRRKEVRSEQRSGRLAIKSESSDPGSRITLERSHWWSLGKSRGQVFRDDGPGNNIENTQSRRREISVTLIRRDPGSGGQWNIGKILTGCSSHDDGAREWRDSQPTKSSVHANSTINIEISAPGYLRFTIPNATNTSHPSNDNRTNKEPAPPKLHIQQDRVFRRQLRTGGPASDRHSERSSPPANGDSSRRSGFFRPSLDSRSGSSAEGEDYKSRVSSEGRPSIKDYTFQSPWNGLCEFKTGIAGRSLKCKHTLLSSSNPSAAASQSVAVSELRFNLPSSKILRPKNAGSEASAKMTTSKRSSVFSVHHTRTSSAESVDGEEEDAGDGMDKLDLSLGQEYAGGGFGGKAAKMGKLIVEDEGLKMLDLLVAANMGVWWRVWERGGG